MSHFATARLLDELSARLQADDALCANLEEEDAHNLIWWHGLDETWQQLLATKGLGKQGMIATNVGADDVMSVQSLRLLRRLTWLDLSACKIDDITPIAHLDHLHELHLSDNDISDIRPLGMLSSLTHLSLDGNRIHDISPLSPLKELKTLNLGFNHIQDFRALSGLGHLESLALHYNHITSLTSLARQLKPLKSLKSLYLGYDERFMFLGGFDDDAPKANQCTDLTPLKELKQLSTLWLTDCQVSDLVPLVGLDELSVLNLSHNDLSDIVPLALLRLDRLYLSGNALSDAEIIWLKRHLPDCVMDIDADVLDAHFINPNDTHLSLSLKHPINPFSQPKRTNHEPPPNLSHA